MTEWRLFSEDAPGFTAVPFFAAHPWVPPARQAGHAERTAMAARIIRQVAAEHQPATVSDLGCGDGSLLEAVRDLPARMWGYDAGSENVQAARCKGLDVRQGDILGPGLEYGELITCCEVLEHLADPHGFLASLPGQLLVVTSPSAETGSWHYEHHAWAWDLDGYWALLEQAGWQPEVQSDCDGGTAVHCGAEGRQRFQAVFAVRKEAR